MEGKKILSGARDIDLMTSRAHADDCNPRGY